MYVLITTTTKTQRSLQLHHAHCELPSGAVDCDGAGITQITPFWFWLRLDNADNVVIKMTLIMFCRHLVFVFSPTGGGCAHYLFFFQGNSELDECVVESWELEPRARHAA
jgi:hypothetical protein